MLSRAVPLFGSPCATSSATCRSRGVNVPHRCCSHSFALYRSRGSSVLMLERIDTTHVLMGRKPVLYQR
jgi:hypothetical protein